jgi:hypothetical protein
MNLESWGTTGADAGLHSYVGPPTTQNCDLASHRFCDSPKSPLESSCGDHWCEIGGVETSGAVRTCLIGSNYLTQSRGRFIWLVALLAEDVALTARPLVVLWGERRWAPWVTR